MRRRDGWRNGRIGRWSLPLALVVMLLVRGWSQWQALSLHPSGWSYSEVNAIDGGQACGGGILSDGSMHAVLWTSLSSGSATLLGGSVSGSWAFDLFGGVVVGPAWTSTVHAGAWSPSYVDLNPPFTAWSNAYGVWVSGGSPLVAGIALVGSVYHAVVWPGLDPNAVVDLHPSGSGQSFAFHISSAGVVGMVDGQAAYWSDYNDAGSYVNLHPAGASASYALGIDSSGKVGGFAVSTHERAWVWDVVSGSSLDIHPVGADGDSEVLGIGTFGGETLAVGFGTFGGQQRAVAWRCLDGNGYVDLHSFLPSGYSYSWARGVWRDADGTWYVGGAAGLDAQHAEAYLWVLRYGDVNGDGCIDDDDWLAVSFSFGQTGCGLAADVNGDGVVDDDDLLAVFYNYGSGC